MKKCPPGEIISRYLDGELEAGESSRLESHLESCLACRKTAEKLGRTGDFLRRAAAVSAPPPARLDRLIAEKFFPRPPEIFLGAIEFDLAALKSAPGSLAWAAERPDDYRTGKGPVEARGCRRAVSGEGIEAEVEFFRSGDGAPACRVAVRDGAGNPIDGARLQLQRAGKLVWSFLTRGPRASVIPRLLPGRYRLRIEHGSAYALTLDLR
ncbi:MAG: zf-HC2 domain-containing protein [Candidatus Erginobacter occultus]|nr:zf-HC2 domain-containing protein [Candidatus Erginobacter occultus]